MEVTQDGCGHSGAFNPVPRDVLTPIRTPSQVMWLMLHNFPNPRVKCEHMAVTKPSEFSFSGPWTLNEVTWVPNNSNFWHAFINFSSSSSLKRRSSNYSGYSSHPDLVLSFPPAFLEYLSVAVFCWWLKCRSLLSAFHSSWRPALKMRERISCSESRCLY